MTNPNIDRLLPARMDFAPLLPPPVTTVSSTSREMRNRAEKQRRDKLNTYISELAEINPFISGSDKRMDKTSILRLSAALMRYHKYHEALATEASSSSDGANQLIENNNHLQGPADNSFGQPTCTSPSPSSSTSLCTPSRLFYTGELPIPDNLTEHMLENMNWFLLLVSSSGKIIYISTSVCKILGHSQNDLMGQSLFNITCPTDHETLRKNLQLQQDDSEPGTSYNMNPLNQRKNFFVKLSQKSTSRSDNAQYEIFQLTGHLRALSGSSATTPAPAAADVLNNQICRKNNRRDSGNQAGQSQDTVLIAIAKMAGMHTFDLVQMEANQEEYFTRHSLEGEIIYCDQRISITAGYMAEEVYGLSAFRFMHHEDVGWCLVSLRQMYSKGGGFGSSTYRLQTKTGDFIFLRTHGHLEFDKETNKPISFICVNTLITPDEGIKGIEMMKKRFAASIKNQEAIKAADEEVKENQKSNIMEYKDLAKMIENHLSNISPTADLADEEDPDPEYMKCIVVSKQLPPPSVTALRFAKRRESISGQLSPQQHQQPTEPQPPDPPSPVQVAEIGGRGTCLGGTRKVKRETEGRLSRRGRPRGSGGVKRKAPPPQLQPFSIKRPPPSPDDDMDGLDWMQGSPSIYLGASTSIFELQLDDDNTDLTNMLGDFTDPVKSEDDDLLLQLSPSHQELPMHHQKVSKLTLSESLEETASVCGALQQLKNVEPDVGV